MPLPHFPPLPLLLLLLLPLPLPPAHALSSCRSADLELARMRRIEAVRGQILSKLRLQAPPPAPPQATPPATPPEELRALYNSTRELLRQRYRDSSGDKSSDREKGGGDSDAEEDYYAKELMRFPMENPGEGPLERWRPTPHSLFFVFNVSRVRAGLGHAHLSRAELRMVRQGTLGTLGTSSGTLGTEQRVELYQGFGNSSWRFLQGRSVRVTAEDEWLWFDVTDSVRQWLSGSEALGVFRLSAHCPCEPGEQREPQLHISIEGFGHPRGDMQAISRRHRRVPHVTAMAQAPESHRSRRDTEGHSCGGSDTQTCCVRPLWIDFRRDLHWKWIHEPRGYMANFCGGACPYIWSSDTHYSKVLALYSLHNPGASAAPCCVPQGLEPLPIIYYVGRKARLEQLSGMVVSACRCS